MRIKRNHRYIYELTARDAVSNYLSILKFAVTDQVYRIVGNEYVPAGQVTGTIYETLRRIARAHGFV